MLIGMIRVADGTACLNNADLRGRAGRCGFFDTAKVTATSLRRLSVAPHLTVHRHLVAAFILLRHITLVQGALEAILTCY